jgi:hypothetical protein
LIRCIIQYLEGSASAIESAHLVQFPSLNQQYGIDKNLERTMNCSSQHDCNYDSDYADKNSQYANNKGWAPVKGLDNPHLTLHVDSGSGCRGKFSVTFYDKDNKVLPGFPQTTDYVAVGGTRHIDAPYNAVKFKLTLIRD